MDTEDLERCIKLSVDAGEVPFMVSATAGKDFLFNYDHSGNAYMVTKNMGVCSFHNINQALLVGPERGLNFIQLYQLITVLGNQIHSS